MSPLGDPAAFEVARIEAGVPANGERAHRKDDPAGSRNLVAHTVSFTKGCYTGQELVARLDARADTWRGACVVSCWIRG